MSLREKWSTLFRIELKADNIPRALPQLFPSKKGLALYLSDRQNLSCFKVTYGENGQYETMGTDKSCPAFLLGDRSQEPGKVPETAGGMALLPVLPVPQRPTTAVGTEHTPVLCSKHRTLVSTEKPVRDQQSKEREVTSMLWAMKTSPGWLQ